MKMAKKTSKKIIPDKKEKNQRQWDLAPRLEHRRVKGKDRKRPGLEK